MISMNHYGVLKNPYQGSHKKVLCVCSAGCLRSPTAAEVLSREPFNFNTRAAGIVNDWAIVPVTLALIIWADEIVMMTEEHYDLYMEAFDSLLSGNQVKHPPIKILHIPDNFAFRDPGLQALIAERYPNASVYGE